MLYKSFPNVAFVLSERFGDGDASGLDLDEVNFTIVLPLCSSSLPAFFLLYVFADLHFITSCKLCNCATAIAARCNQ